MSDIFISYASEDRAKAKVLARTLERRGFSVWWDPEIPPGEEFRQVITKALDEAKCVIVLWSKASVGSRWVREEANRGDHRGILIPALIDDVEIPLGFGEIQAVHLVDWKGSPSYAGFGQLVEAISKILHRPPLLHPPPKKCKAWKIIAVTFVILVAVVIYLLVRPPDFKLVSWVKDPNDSNTLWFTFEQTEPKVPPGGVFFTVSCDKEGIYKNSVLKEIKIEAGVLSKGPAYINEKEGELLRVDYVPIKDANNYSHKLIVIMSDPPNRLEISSNRLKKFIFLKKSEFWNSEKGIE
jgi:hypothetical protein